MTLLSSKPALQADASNPGAFAQDRHAKHFGTIHVQRNLESRVLRGGVVTLASQAARVALQLGSTAVLARLLTPADFGLIAMVTAITGFAALFKDLGLSQATVQRVEITHQQVSTLFWVNVLASIALGLFVAACSPLVAWLYAEPRLVWVTSAIGTTFVLSGVTVQHLALLRRQMRFGVLATIDLASIPVGIAIAISMALAGAEYWALVGQSVGQAGAAAIGAWMASGWRPGPATRGAGVRPMLRFGGGLTGFSVLNYFTRNADSIIIGYWLGGSALGLYSRAYHLLMQQDHIKNAVGPVVVSALSRLQGDPDRFRRVYLRAIGAVALACMPIVALLFVFADEVIAILLGPGWGEAATVFRVLAPAAMLGAINIAPGWLCVARGRVKIQVVWAAISAPVVVGGFVVGVAWGVVGVAAAFSVTWCIMLLLFIAMACRGSPVSFWQVIATAWPAMVASVAATAVCVAAGGHVLQADAPIAVGIAVKGLLFASTFAAVLLCHSSARRCAAELWRSRGIAMAIREAEEVA